MMTSQRQQIRAYMSAGNWISPMLAFHAFKCWRLAARIHQIKGDLVGTGTVVVRRERKAVISGTKFVEYTIKKEVVK